TSNSKTFLDVKGRKYREEDLRGKVVLVVYWATWCPPCRREIPVLNELHKKYSNRGALILAVSQDEDIDTLKNFLANEELGQSIRYPVVFGPPYIEYFGTVEALPTILLMDRQGKIVGQHRGMAPPEALAGAIEKIL